MAIALEPHAGDVPTTQARAGLARAGDARSGYPPFAGAQLPLYALSGVARSKAFRSGAHSPNVFIAIGGIHYGTGRADAATKVLIDSLSISEVIDETPNKATFVTMGFAPTVGQAVVVTLGSKNNRARSFGGTILSVEQSYVGDRPEHAQYRVDGIDPQWGLDRRLVNGRYRALSATAIAIELVTTYAPGYQTTFIAPGLEAIDEITFTNESLTDALTRLAKRVGGYWYADYLNAIHFWSGAEDMDFAGLTNPTILNRAHVGLDDVQSARDLSQVVTRVISEGGGGTAIASRIQPGETILPVDTAEWYNAAGGLVRSGPQRLRYSSASLGGRGTLVGPGAAPVVAPTLALVSGGGVNSGTHYYAVTFVTASGESLRGPTNWITTGPLASPSAPTAGTPTPGSGPNAGTHSYAVSFLTSVGETTPGPAILASTGVTTPPAAPPTPGIAIVGSGPDAGVHDYAVTFVTPTGETTPSPISGSVTTSVALAAPGAASAAQYNHAAATQLGPGTYRYKVTFTTADGETTTGPESAVTIAAVDPPQGAAADPLLGGIIPTGSYLYWVTFVTAGGETQAFVNSNFVSLGHSGWEGYHSARVWGLPSSTDPRVTGRRIYRSPPNGPYEPATAVLVATINDTTTYEYVDNAASGGANPPPTNTTAKAQVTLSAIPTGPGGAGITGRRIYRTAANGSTFYRLASLNDTTTTSYTDTTTTVSTANPEPGTNTTGRQTVPLSDIARGDSSVTARRIYRRSGGLGLKLATTIGDNTTKTWSDTVPNASLGAAVPTVNTASVQRIPLTIPLGPSLVTGRKIYRSPAGSQTLKLAATLADNTTTVWVDTVTDAALGAPAPATNTAVANQVAISGIPVGPGGTTMRKLYRTAANQSPLLFLATIIDNVTTTFTDATADSALGATAPATDTSGLPQPDGIVLPGVTSLIVAGTGWAAATGGWAIIGNGAQVIRYSAITATSLTGIPASGDGAINASVSYNSTITAAPALTGIPASGDGAIRYPIIKGDAVNLVVIVDDLAAQAALAALIGGDGVQETPLSDNRISEAEARARGEALVALRGEVEVAIHYRSRDINSHAGRTVTVNLGPPTSLYGDYTIQQVTMTPTTPAATVMPTYDVQASTTRFSFENLLALARKAKG